MIALLFAAAFTGLTAKGEFCVMVTTLPPSVECASDLTPYVKIVKARSPTRWSALATYSDGVVITHEGMRSERLCREVLCSLRYSQTCAEHEDLERAQAKKAMEDARAYHFSVAAWRRTHPCRITKDRMECSLPPNGNEYRIFFEDGTSGKYSSAVGMFLQSTTNVTGTFPVTRYVTHAVCFEEKK